MQAEVADGTIPNTGHLDDKVDNTQPQRCEPGQQRREAISVLHYKVSL